MFSTILQASAQTTAPRAMAPPASLSSAGPEEEEPARVTPGKRGTEDTSWTQVKGRREWVMLLMLPPPRHEFWRGFCTWLQVGITWAVQKATNARTAPPDQLSQNLWEGMQAAAHVRGPWVTHVL